ncbi:MAG: hypothetical protein M1827_002829 [Pycnora praestabilis]|nr:MAG: hypothetical protein M1827_002829 [Pycnora praestabilis]
MSPHSDVPSYSVNGRSNQTSGVRCDSNATIEKQGTTRKMLYHPGRSRLLRPDPEELLDLICVGFGPASLAIAIALHDALTTSEIPIFGERPPRVSFLERQEHFAWHAGMLLPGAKMQISFIKDLATLRDPRSNFTFLNYLHKQNRLVQFANLGTFLPLRIEYEDYMRWCAAWFDDVVHYSHEVLEVLPEKTVRSNNIDSFVVRTRDVVSGEVLSRKARHVVIAVGGKPRIPPSLPQRHPRVLHSSVYSTALPALLNDPRKSYHVAVIGSGQSAAEIFNDLQRRFPNSRTSLIIKGAALRPSDDSPFVNEIFDPYRVDSIYQQPSNIREAAISQDRGTNYGVVRLELLEHIYSAMYTQRLQNPNEEHWQHRILNHRTVTSIQDLNTFESVSKPLRLFLSNNSGVSPELSNPQDESMEVDAVLVATGYVRDAHEDMLKQARHLMPGGDTPDNKWRVQRDYRIVFNEKVDPKAGIWLQGCNESTHGASLSLFYFNSSNFLFFDDLHRCSKLVALLYHS